MSHKRKRNNDDTCWNEFKFTDSERRVLKTQLHKRRKIVPCDKGMIGWVSATRIKHYMLNDTCLDWLNLHGNTTCLDGKKLDIARDDRDILLDGGTISEKKVYDEIKNIYNDKFKLVFTQDDYDKFKKERNMTGIIREKYKQTIEYMKNGVPFIAQGTMINYSNMTFGIADLLVRSDYLELLFDNFYPDNDIHDSAHMLCDGINVGYHYRVIDYKWTTMGLCVDERTLRNSEMFPAYKGQLTIYTSCLGEMQGYLPRYAYIMCKAWKIDKHSKGSSCFDRLGVIDYGARDKQYIHTTKKAIQWVQRVMTEGTKWKYGSNAPSVPEMYPNMSKDIDPRFRYAKRQIAEYYGEITQVWYVTHKNRNNAFKHGVYDVRDPKCTVEVLGLNTASDRTRVIADILSINYRTQTSDIVRPKVIKNNTLNWQVGQCNDYYVDFETINCNLYANPEGVDIDNSYVDSDVIFMVGIGFEHNADVNTGSIVEAIDIDKTKCCHYNSIENTWEIFCVYMANFSVDNEIEILRIFFEFIAIRSNLLSKIRPRLFHWTSAELRFLKTSGERIANNSIPKKQHRYMVDLVEYFSKVVVWVDMCDIFCKEPIVVCGSYRFKLKHIANAFYSHGLIKTKWIDGSTSDGFMAMLSAIKLYRIGDVSDSDDIIKIVKYNEIDCRVIWEIVNYLRKHHCKHYCKHYCNA